MSVFGTLAGRVRLCGSGLAAFCALLTLLGAVARLRPSNFVADALFRLFPTEDAYLMLTIARNIAMGRGMTYSAGTVPTNGVQPLTAFIQAACFWVVDGDRTAALQILLLVYTAIGAGTAVLIYHLGKVVFPDTAYAQRAPLLAASAWWASPAILYHSMNMMETGLYAASVALVTLLFVRKHILDNGAWTLGQAFGLGTLLGVTFWVRNDAVFLMFAVGAAHLAFFHGATLRRRLLECLVMAAGCIMVCLPWLLYNVIGFGSLMPISGQSQMQGESFLANLMTLWLSLAHYLTLATAYNSSMSGEILITSIAAMVSIAIGIRVVRQQFPTATLLKMSLVPILYAAGLIIFYVFFFSAPYFISRYLFALSPFVVLATAAVWLAVWQRLPRLGGTRLVVPIGLLVLFCGGGLGLGFAPLPGALWQGTHWVLNHVDDQQWVAAFQSGTLGFFHDRTFNLDGKVDPAALVARRAHRHHAYVSTLPAVYIVDWLDLVDQWWTQDSTIREQFKWILREETANLGILLRVEPNTGPSSRDRRSSPEID